MRYLLLIWLVSNLGFAETYHDWYEKRSRITRQLISEEEKEIQLERWQQQLELFTQEKNRQVFLSADKKEQLKEVLPSYVVKIWTSEASLFTDLQYADIPVETLKFELVEKLIKRFDNIDESFKDSCKVLVFQATSAEQLKDLVKEEEHSKRSWCLLQFYKKG